MRMILFLICCLLASSSLLAASEGIPIPLPGGNFEGIDLKRFQARNESGVIRINRNQWKLAEAPNIAEGKTSVALTGALQVIVTIPPEHRGRSLKLTFLGKGTSNFQLSYTEFETDSKGKDIPGKRLRRPVTCDLMLKKGNCPKFRPISIYTPPMNPRTSKVNFMIRQNHSPFYVDDFRLHAYKIPFYQQGKPIPLPDSLASLLNGKWDFSHDRVNRLVSPDGKKAIVAFYAGGKMNLTLPLESYRNKWLEVIASGRGEQKIEVQLFGGTIGPVTAPQKYQFCSEETTVRFWLPPAGPLADELKLCLSSRFMLELSNLQIRASDKPLIPLRLSVEDIREGRLPKDFLVGAWPKHPGLVDIAPYADVIYPSHYTPRSNAPVDGSLGTGTRRPVEFRFHKAVEVREIRLTMPSTYLTIWADTTGKGVYDTLVVERSSMLRLCKANELEDYVWYRKPLDQPLTLYGLQYKMGGHAVGLYGEKLYEFQILVSPETAAPWLSNRPRGIEKSALLEAGSPIPMPQVKEEDRLLFGFTLEPWMFGMIQAMQTFYKNPSVPVPPLAEWKIWQSVAEDLKGLYANFILLFPPHTSIVPKGVKPMGSYPAPPMWNSKVWYVSQPNDMLRSFVQSCRDYGFKLFVIPRQWLFKKGTVNGPVKYAKEIAEQGVESIPVCMDEHYYAMRQPLENTLQKRKIFLERLAKLAATMKDIKREARKINPKAETFGAWSSYYYYDNRLVLASPHDAWGFDGETDIIGGDGTYFTLDDAPFGSFTPTVAVAEYASLSPGRRVLATQNYNWMTRWDSDNNRLIRPLVYDDYPSTCIYGSALSCYFAKAEAFDYWRYNFMDEFCGPRGREATRIAGKMTKVLSAWGGKKAQIPKDVMILRSRTSEDWWSLKKRYDFYIYKSYFSGPNAYSNAKKTHYQKFLQDIDKDFQRERLKKQGVTQYNWCITQLIAHSIPNETYLMNRPSAWKDRIQDYKVVILPLAYAISPEAADALRKAADAGVRIIAIVGPEICTPQDLGTADELGEPHPQGSLLKPLLEDGRIQLFRMDVITGNHHLKLAHDFYNLVRKNLEDRGGSAFQFHKPLNQDIQCHMLEISPREKLVLLINYSERDTEVKLSLNLPEGNYQIELCRLGVLTKGLINDKGAFTANELKDIGIRLPREDCRIIRILPGS